MSILQTLIRRNRAFAETRFDPRLRMRPSLNTTVITCLDPRVDPAVVLGAEQGEIAVLRNPGGRVTPQTIEQLLILLGPDHVDLPEGVRVADRDRQRRVAGAWALGPRLRDPAGPLGKRWGQPSESGEVSWSCSEPAPERLVE